MHTQSVSTGQLDLHSVVVLILYFDLQPTYVYIGFAFSPFLSVIVYIWSFAPLPIASNPRSRFYRTTSALPSSRLQT
jgi:hypothetical protein